MAPATSAARPKRAAEEFARSNHDDSNISKKPRFDYRNPSTLAADAPEDDIILDADVIGKSGAQTKRNAVNIDGYESDSDNDNFDARARERDRSKNQQSKDEEDDDMFADLQENDGDEDEELEREGKKNKKNVKFLDPSQIEGQVMNSTSGGHVSGDILLGGNKGKKRREDEEESESSGDEEERDQLPEEVEDEDAQELGAGSKKKHAPRLDAFNLREEEEEGRYDESGNYHEIYEAERELLMRQYKRETGEEWKASPQRNGSSGQDAESAFCYRWSDSRDGGEAHGPYDGPTMKAWNDAGYFGEGVEFQRVGDDEWSRLLDVTS
ncbi:hypothetical protein HII31_08792 [Pseudocercospora fuligena]|uniref:GYF domain-containing protein n=1 Tax=Pseudocercospora fuligena TaxID=685502 RepID=A0A8H6VFX6_9PEZI|nr:hypothetical protein HII31_08792 [Pseudocercospora fuligena]